MAGCCWLQMIHMRQRNDSLLVFMSHSSLFHSIWLMGCRMKISTRWMMILVEILHWRFTHTGGEDTIISPPPVILMELQQLNPHLILQQCSLKNHFQYQAWRWGCSKHRESRWWRARGGTTADDKPQQSRSTRKLEKRRTVSQWMTMISPS